MPFAELLQLVPAAYVLVFFRVAGMMIFVPYFGSARIPRRVKVLLAAVIAFALSATVPLDVAVPATLWGLTVALGGELVFGLAMGMALSFVFVAVQWAGEMIGQQMGLNLSEVFDPQFGASGSLVGELYFMLTLVVFLLLNGHHAVLIGLRESFDALPLLSVAMTPSLLDLVVGLFQAATNLAIQLAAPMLVTMLIVDLSMGFISKTVPQLNVMSAGMGLRSVVGLIVLIVGAGLTSEVIRGALLTALRTTRDAWSTPFP